MTLLDKYYFVNDTEIWTVNTNLIPDKKLN